MALKHKSSLIAEFSHSLLKWLLPWAPNIPSYFAIGQPWAWDDPSGVREVFVSRISSAQVLAHPTASPELPLISSASRFCCEVQLLALSIQAVNWYQPKFNPSKTWSTFLTLQCSSSISSGLEAWVICDSEHRSAKNKQSIPSSPQGLMTFKHQLSSSLKYVWVLFLPACLLCRLWTYISFQKHFPFTLRLQNCRCSLLASPE